MLLVHSVGTGKTCTGIRVSSLSFYNKGFRVLWVTRGQLKKDVYKNLDGDNSCLPASVDTKASLPANWVKPITYRQLTNYILGRNKTITKQLSDLPGKDKLYRTLIIIDEAHKLVDPGMKPAERANYSALCDAIHNSYQVSGHNSCRVLLMSATPFVTAGKDLFDLINLCKPREDAMHFDMDVSIRRNMVNPDGTVTLHGLRTFGDWLSPCISYLNRTMDYRVFARPSFFQVNVDISGSEWREYEEARGLYASVRRHIAELRKNKPAVADPERSEWDMKMRDLESLAKEYKSEIEMYRIEHLNGAYPSQYTSILGRCGVDQGDLGL